MERNLKSARKPKKAETLGQAVVRVARAMQPYTLRILVTLAVLAVLGAGVWSYTFINSLLTPSGADQVARVLSNLTGRTVTVAGPVGVTLNFKGIEGWAEGVDVSNPKWAEADSFATVPKARVTFAWLPLFRGRLVPKAVQLNGAVFDLQTRKAGETTFATWHIGPLSPQYTDSEDSRVRLTRLPHIELTNAGFSQLDTFDVVHTLSVPRLYLQPAGEGARAVLSVAHEGGMAVFSGEAASLAQLLTRSTQVSAVLETPGGRIEARGSAGLGGNNTLVLRSAITDLSLFGRAVGIENLPRRMPLAVTAQVTGTPGAFEVTQASLRLGAEPLGLRLTGSLGPQRRAGLGNAAPPPRLLSLAGEVSAKRVHLDSWALLRYARPGEGIERAWTLAAPGGVALNLDFGLGAEQALWRRAAFDGLKGRFHMAGRIVQLEDWSGAFGSGRIEFDLLATLPPHPEIAVNFHAHDFDTDAFFKGLGVPPLISAVTDFAMRFDGKGEDWRAMVANLKGAAQFALQEGALHGAAARGLVAQLAQGEKSLALSCAAGRVALYQGESSLDRVLFRSGGLPVIAEGVADLRDASADIRFYPQTNDSKTDYKIKNYVLNGPLAFPNIGVFEKKPPEAQTNKISKTKDGGEENEASPYDPDYASLPDLAGSGAQGNDCLNRVLGRPGTPWQSP